MNVAVFASGRGTNFSAIQSAVKKGSLKCCLKLLVCDNPKAAVIAKAKRAGVEVFLIDRLEFASSEGFEDSIIAKLRSAKIDLVVLAGFMRILSPRFVKAMPLKIINIHPSLLPSFKGAHGIKDAFLYGVKVTGVTVHYVDQHMDHGPIILQEAVPIKKNDTVDSLEARIHRVEHAIYPRAIRLILSRSLKVRGRRVISS